MDNQNHEVVIHVANEAMTQTVAAGSSQTGTLVESSGTYSVNATIDGTMRLNSTVEYYPAGEEGDRVGGPALFLEIDSDGYPDFYQSVA